MGVGLFFPHGRLAPFYIEATTVWKSPSALHGFPISLPTTPGGLPWASGGMASISVLQRCVGLCPEYILSWWLHLSEGGMSWCRGCREAAGTLAGTRNESHIRCGRGVGVRRGRREEG